MLELHCHTTCSDGTLTPKELVAAAMEAGVRALAITDHDTLAGWAEAQEAAADTELEIVPGLELSTTEKGRSLHILGFYPDAKRLQPILDKLQSDRRHRASVMLKKLTAIGYPVSLSQLPAQTVPGRPHIAQALVAAGHCRSVDQAFKKWLKDGGLAYVPYDGLSTVEGIAALRAAGAVPVWAHPFLFKAALPIDLLPKFIDAGLMGLEVYHPSHSPKQVQALKGYCETYGLLTTGGSDYHGPYPNATVDSKPQLNRFNVPASLLPPLKAAAAKLKTQLSLNEHSQ